MTGKSKLSRLKGANLLITLIILGNLKVIADLKEKILNPIKILVKLQFTTILQKDNNHLNLKASAIKTNISLEVIVNFFIVVIKTSSEMEEALNNKTFKVKTNSESFQVK